MKAFCMWMVLQLIGPPYNYEGSFTNSDKICIAHLMNLGEPEYYYMGFVDEIAIYNRALNATEISNQIASASSGIGICNETVTSLLKDLHRHH